jgi:hypothetical protein
VGLGVTGPPAFTQDNGAMNTYVLMVLEPNSALAGVYATEDEAWAALRASKICDEAEATVHKVPIGAPPTIYLPDDR